MNTLEHLNLELDTTCNDPEFPPTGYSRWGHSLGSKFRAII